MTYVDAKFVRTPFNIDVPSLSDSLQEDFLDFVEYSTACVRFKFTNIFVVKMTDSYKKIATQAVKYILLSSYLFIIILHFLPRSILRQNIQLD